MSDSGHANHSSIGPMVEKLPKLWQRHVPDTGVLHCYITKSGLVVFLDSHKRRGWTMLTECPSTTVNPNVNELRAMIAGEACERFTGLPVDSTANVVQPDLAAIDRLVKTSMDSPYVPDDGEMEYELAKACEDLIRYIRQVIR